MILNFGSINLDLVYRVPALPKAGETLGSTDYRRYLGGKGINQSIAAHRSGAEVRHIGCLGADGAWLREQIADFGLCHDGISTVETHTGHAVIFVDDAGENQIVLSEGSNGAFTEGQISAALDSADPESDWIMCQNETNLVHELARSAKDRGFCIAYSAAPFVAEHAIPMLAHINLLAVNEGEAAALQAALGKDVRCLSLDALLITKGAAGVDLYMPGQEVVHQPAFVVTPQDTTGAGDTFVGALIARLDDGPVQALRFAAAAAAIQVTRPGAASAIPTYTETCDFLKEHS